MGRRLAGRSRRAALLLLPLLAACAGWVPPSQRPCGPPRFPYAQGWLGGDAAYSVALSPTRTLWLFGDSFVGDSDQTHRVQPGVTIVHNSIALSECAPDAHFRIDYAWGHGADGRPRAFFDTGVADPYWWLFDGFLYAGRLYVGLLEVEKSGQGGSLGLPFRLRGMQLARIDDWEGPPEQWRFEVQPLWPFAGALPGSTMVVHGDHLYLFTFLDLDDGRHPRVLARLPLAALDETPPRLPERLEYLARGGRWKPGLDPEDARVLMDDDATEMSVRLQPERDRWVALYSTPGSDRVRLRTAPRLEGPWSAPYPVFRIPELDPEIPGNPDRDVFCYAAKEHPQFGAEDRLLFTYVCNLLARSGEPSLAALRRLAERMDLYRPNAVSIPFPGYLP